VTTQAPTVTVIIPTYNSSGTLRLSLETVLWQDFVDFEVWVVGDGCTDDSHQVVASFKDERLHWTNLPGNSGTPSAPRNEGLRRAQGELVAYLGHDDLWFPWHLSELVSLVREDDRDFVYSLGIGLDRTGIYNTFTVPEDPGHPKCEISPSNWLHRKDLTETVGLWSLEVKFGNDRDFLRRVLAANVRLGFRQQLSVLKFRAAGWRMYALTTDLPQATYVEAMRRNAEGVRLELLQELATVFSRYEWLRQRVVPGRTPVHAVIEIALDAYGRHRWPVYDLMYRRWRRGSGLADKERVPH
jgi:glycosyltransferase involved in cell wall biosynthesis